MKRKPFPRLMWADYDASDKRTPVAIYATKAEQRANRPDLQPVRVRISRVPVSSPNIGHELTAPRAPDHK